MTCPHCRDATGFFDERVVRWELKRYLRRGPTKTTLMLARALEREGVQGRDLLDIGGGLGALQHVLLDAGLERATSAEASPAFLEAARREAERRGLAPRVDFLLGDFVEMGSAVGPAHVVTLDRVICCYPDMPALVGASAAHARELWGAVFPRERLLTRVAMGILNLVQRARKSSFRAYVHPTEGVSRLLAEDGFALRAHETTLFWQVMVWRRVGSAAA